MVCTACITQCRHSQFWDQTCVASQGCCCGWTTCCCWPCSCSVQQVKGAHQLKGTIWCAQHASRNADMVRSGVRPAWLHRAAAAARQIATTGPAHAACSMQQVTDAHRLKGTIWCAQHASRNADTVRSGVKPAWLHRAAAATGQIATAGPAHAAHCAPHEVCPAMLHCTRVWRHLQARRSSNANSSDWLTSPHEVCPDMLHRTGVWRHLQAKRNLDDCVSDWLKSPHAVRLALLHCTRVWRHLPARCSSDGCVSDWPKSPAGQ